MTFGRRDEVSLQCKGQTCLLPIIRDLGFLISEFPCCYNATHSLWRYPYGPIPVTSVGLRSKGNWHQSADNYSACCTMSSKVLYICPTSLASSTITHKALHNELICWLESRVKITIFDSSWNLSFWSSLYFIGDYNAYCGTLFTLAYAHQCIKDEISECYRQSVFLSPKTEINNMFLIIEGNCYVLIYSLHKKAPYCTSHVSLNTTVMHFVLIESSVCIHLSWPNN